MAMSKPQTCFQCGHVLTEDVLHPGDAAPHVCRPPVGDALRTTSIEAAAKVLAPTASNWAAYLPDAIAVVDAVLGVAMPSIRRDALGEAIAVIEAMPGDHGGAWLHRRELAERLRGLRDTQAPA